MPLKKTTIAKLAALAKVKPEDIEAAIAHADEQEIPIDDTIQGFNKTELDARDRNTYNTAKKTGEEMLIKAIKQKHGIEIPGEDADKVIEAIQKKTKAEIDQNPDARISEMERTLTTAKNSLKLANDKVASLETEKATIQLDTKLLALFPADRVETMTTDEYLALIKSKIKIETRDGKEVVIKDGQPVLDAKSLEPVPVKDAVEGYFVERNWKKAAAPPPPTPPGGRGGGNSNPGGMSKFSKLSEVRKDIEDKGINPLGEKAQSLIQAAIKDNPDIDMNH